MNLDEFVQIESYAGEGYRPLVDYGEWRVAILRFIGSLLPENIDFIECHRETDEVFVLLEGACILLIGVPEGESYRIEPLEMAPLKLYNIRKGVYHSHILSRNATVLIIENRDTGAANSHRISLSESQRAQVCRVGTDRK